MWRYIRPVFTPAAADGLAAGVVTMDRTDLYSNAVLSGAIVNGVHILLHCLILLPEGSAEGQLLASAEGKDITFPWQVMSAVCSCRPSR